jgi:hypothetical protein
MQPSVQKRFMMINHSPRCFVGINSINMEKTT